MPATTNDREYESRGRPVRVLDVTKVRSYSAHPAPFDWDDEVDRLMRTTAEARSRRVTSDPPSINVTYPSLCGHPRQLARDLIAMASTALTALPDTIGNDGEKDDDWRRAKAESLATSRADSPQQGTSSTIPAPVASETFTLVQRHKPGGKKKPKGKKGKARQPDTQAPGPSTSTASPATRSNPFRPLESSASDAIRNPDSEPLQDTDSNLQMLEAQTRINSVETLDNTARPTAPSVPTSPILAPATTPAAKPEALQNPGKPKKRKSKKGKAKANDKSAPIPAQDEAEQMPSSPETVKGDPKPRCDFPLSPMLTKLLDEALRNVRLRYVALKLDDLDPNKRPPPRLQPYKHRNCENIACAGCGKSESELGHRLTKICSRCTLWDPWIRYCNTECQKKGWKAHRSYCGSVFSGIRGTPQDLMPARMDVRHWEIAHQKVHHTWDVFIKIGDEYQTMKMVIDASRLLDEAAQRHHPSWPRVDTVLGRPVYCFNTLRGYKFENLRRFLDKTLEDDALDNFMPIWWTREKRDEYVTPFSQHLNNTIEAVD